MEYQRVVSTVHVTEEGIFHKDKVPEDYVGPVVDMEVVHQIMFVKENGEFQVFTLKAPKAMNEKREEEEYTDSEVEKITHANQESFLDKQNDKYLHRLPSETTDRANLFIEIIDEDVDEDPSVAEAERQRRESIWKEPANRDQ